MLSDVRLVIPSAFSRPTLGLRVAADSRRFARPSAITASPPPPLHDSGVREFGVRVRYSARRCLGANREFLDVLGVESVENIIGRDDRELSHRASHDGLTGLANRWSLNERVQQVLAIRQSANVLYLDLAQFKVINDSPGHQVGDEMPAAVAQRPRSIGPLAGSWHRSRSPGRRSIRACRLASFTSQTLTRLPRTCFALPTPASIARRLLESPAEMRVDADRELCASEPDATCGRIDAVRSPPSTNLRRAKWRDGRRRGALAVSRTDRADRVRR
jgi:hypothetical protein